MLTRFATPAGRDALVEAARDTRRDHAGWDDEEPADLAARVLADAITQHPVLARAHLRLLRVPVERPTYERARARGADASRRTGRGRS